MSILKKYKSISNEGVFDIFKKTPTVEELLKLVLNANELKSVESIDNDYGRLFVNYDYKTYKPLIVKQNENLKGFKFKELVKDIVNTIPSSLKRINDEDSDNSVYTDSANAVMKVLGKYFKDGKSPIFLGNTFLFYNYNKDSGINTDHATLKESDEVDKIYLPPSISDVKALAKDLYNTYKSFEKEINEVILLAKSSDKKFKDVDGYYDFNDYVYPLSFWFDGINDFVKIMKNNYTMMLKFLSNCVDTNTVSKEAYSLEDGEETVTEEVQPELTETDETAEDSSDENVETSEEMEETSGGDSEENTESDLSVSGQEDSEVDSTSQQETGAPTEEPFQEEREVELDDPEVEKQEIVKYLSALLGDAVSELTLYSAGEVNRPLYHVSMNPNVKIFSPKVSSRTLGTEDRSVPRVSTSTSIVGCLNGYQSMFSDMAGRARKNFTGLYTVYELPYQYAVKPSKKLLSDVETSDEYWLVSWKKETYSIRPNTVCEFTIPQVQTTYGSDGEDKLVTMFLKVLGESLYLTHDVKLVKGYYEITLRNYDYDYPLENNNKIEVKEITENDYNKVTSLSIMIKKKG